MNITVHTKAVALATLVAGLAVPAVASAEPISSVRERAVQSQTAPDAFERAAARGQAVPDVFERAAARGQAVPGGLLLPDEHGRGQAVPDAFERAAARGEFAPPDAFGRYAASHPYGASSGPVAAAPVATGDGFSWGDAGIGAGIALGALALFSGLVALLRQLRHPPQTV